VSSLERRRGYITRAIEYGIPVPSASSVTVVRSGPHSASCGARSLGAGSPSRSSPSQVRRTPPGPPCAVVTPGPRCQRSSGSGAGG
jgi:hypothetical protein